MKKKIVLMLITVVAICGCMFMFTACGPHTHTFGQQVVSDAFKASGATCEDKATYYYSCTCGEKGTETFESGEKLGHSFTNYVFNNDATCIKNGTETATCDSDNCNEIDTREKLNTKLEHNYATLKSNELTHWMECECSGKAGVEFHRPGAEATETTDQKCTVCDYVLSLALGHVHILHLTKVDAKPQSCTEEGNILYYICSCEKWFTDNTATTEITDKSSVTIEKDDHSYTTLKSDELTHWMECECGDKLNIENHIYSDYASNNNGTKTEKCNCGALGNLIIADERVLIIKDNVVIGLTAYGKILNDIVILNDITSIGDRAFLNCTSLESIEIPDSVTSIGSNAFYGCSSLTSIEIPDSVTSIGSNAFSGCSSLTSIEIPNSVTSIGSSAFSDCSSLESVTIGDSVTSIGPSEFWNCSSLTNIEVDQDNANYKSIDGNLYAKDGKILVQYATGKSDTTFIIPSSVTSIGYSAFRDCNSLTSIVIPDSVTSIGPSAFAGCSSLTSVTIGDSVTGIGYGVFSGCSSLTSIEIPNSVTSIDPNAFEGCSSLTSIEMPNSVTSIGDYAFRGCSSLTSIEIPNSVTSIGDDAFSGCSSLTSIEIPNSVTSIGDDAFSGCSSLESVTIGDSVTSIGDDAFYNCSSLTNITIPNSVTSIGSYAFFCCSSLTSIEIPNSVTHIGDNAFAGCSSLTYNIKNGLKYLGNSDNPYLYLVGPENMDIATASIDNNCRFIGREAFADCSSLESVTIGDSVTSIGRYAFYYCSSLTSIKYCGSESQWEEISKGDYWDRQTGKYTITYNYTGE